MAEIPLPVRRYGLVEMTSQERLAKLLRHRNEVKGRLPGPAWGHRQRSGLFQEEGEERQETSLA